MLSWAFLCGFRLLQEDFFNWWNLTRHISRLFHHSVLFRLLFFLLKQLFFFSLLLPNSFFPDSARLQPERERKSPSLSKQENPRVTHERSMSTWRGDRAVMFVWLWKPEMWTKQSNVSRCISEQTLRRETCWFSETLKLSALVISALSFSLVQNKELRFLPEL